MKRLNLLPKDVQRELAHEKLLYSVAVTASIATLILLLGVIVQFGVGMYLSRKAVAVEDEIAQLKRTANKTENAAVKQKIRSANSQIDDFTTLSALTPQWSAVLAAFFQHVPSSVKITQFDADAQKKQVTIEGYSPTRDLVIDLYNNINADKAHFKDINYPLENVTKPVDVNFTFTFTIVDEVLIPKP